MQLRWQSTVNHAYLNNAYRGVMSCICACAMLVTLPRLPLQSDVACVLIQKACAGLLCTRTAAASSAASCVAACMLQACREPRDAGVDRTPFSRLLARLESGSGLDSLATQGVM